MDEMMTTLEIYIQTLKADGLTLPGYDKYTPHFRSISAASGVDYEYVVKEPYRQRVLLAIQEIGLTPRKRAKWDSLFNQNRTLINNYLKWLEDHAFSLPEDPWSRGKVFFPQVEIEAGLNRNALRVKKIDGAHAYNMLLRRMVEKAVTSLGLGVRVLPQSLSRTQHTITYEHLLDKGTNERKKELIDKPEARQQTYNTRSALNHFRKALGLETTSPVGYELASGFKANLQKATAAINNEHSRKKFQTGIHWWHDFYKRLLKEPSIPDELQPALTHLIDRSGLSHSVLAKLIGVAPGLLRDWYHGRRTPSGLNINALYRMESLFKLPAGTLSNKASGSSLRRRFKHAHLPTFLQKDPNLFHRISKHLPDDFCTLALDKQELVVESIRTEILHGDDAYTLRLMELIKLPYRLKVWPKTTREEFASFAHFKMGERPPIGMKRSGKWRPVTKKSYENIFAYLFGALCLPPDAEDVRLRGLGLCESQLTLAVVACPLLIDWYIRFRCEARNQYTKQAISLLVTFKAMLKPVTGWVRQKPHLASRLRQFQIEGINYVSPELVATAQDDWDAVCDAAITYYEQLIRELKMITTVARNPFGRIEGIVRLENPLKAVGILIKGMRGDLPNRHTQPVLYHTAIRDCALVLLIAITGLRRNTIVQLNYTGEDTGHLFKEDGGYIVTAPREFFKEENSPYFGPKDAQEDYRSNLPDSFGLNDIFAEYLNISRSFLINRYHRQSQTQALFINSRGAGPTWKVLEKVRLKPENVHKIYARAVEQYLVENRWRGTGIPQVKRTGPHSLRHIRGTAAIKKTGSFQIAADANQHSERIARKYYAKYRPEDRNRRVNDVLFGDDD